MYSVIEENCTGCGRCFDACPNQAIILVDKKAQINYDKCNECGRCLDVCRSDAIMVRTRMLQKSESMVYDIEKAYEQRPANVQPPTKSQLLLDLCDLFLKVANIFVNNDAKPAQTNASVNAVRVQKRPLGQGNCQRRRRGCAGRRGKNC